MNQYDWICKVNTSTATTTLKTPPAGKKLKVAKIQLTLDTAGSISLYYNSDTPKNAVCFLKLAANAGIDSQDMAIRSGDDLEPLKLTITGGGLCTGVVCGYYLRGKNS